MRHSAECRRADLFPPTPKHFLFAHFGGGGKTPPMLAIVRRLVARGHNVQVLSDLCNQKELEAEGASFACWTGVPRRSDKSAAADPIKDWEVSSPLTLLARLRDRLFVGPALAYARDVLHELERFPANTVVTSEMLLGVMAAAESVGVPCVALSANIYLYPLPGVPRFGPGFQPAKGCPVACGTPWCETSVSVCLEKQRPSSMLPARAGVASTLSPFVLPSVLLPHALPVLDKIVTESPRLRHTLFSCNTYSAIVRRRAFVIRFAPGTKQTKRSPWARIEGVQSAREITFNLPEELPRLLSFTEAVWAEGARLPRLKNLLCQVSTRKENRMIAKTLFLVTLVAIPAAYSQTTPPPATETFQSPQKGCLIVKHKGTVGRRLIFTALTGFPFALGDKYDLVDSLGYQGAKLSYQGKELEQIQKTGTRIVVLPSKPRPEDAKNARESCLCEPSQRGSGAAIF